MTLISLITPTHDAKYLDETYASVIQQRVPFEWIVVPNRGATPPTAMIRDPNVRIVRYPHLVAPDKPQIGKLKKFACSQAKGDLLVELDHDDLLVPGILKRLLALYDEGADFIYSDTASFTNEGKPRIYREDCGWETYDFQWYSHILTAHRNFPLTARSLCSILTAPDHVRAWRRTFYEHLGGHDETLGLGDDHDLVIRSYLAGGRFAHTGSCGYLYRVHANTVEALHKQIQLQSSKNHDKYIKRLVTEWCRRHGHQELHDWNGLHDPLGPLWGAIHVDPVVALSLEQREIMHFFQTCWSRLVPGGWVFLDLPSSEGILGATPYARSFWTRHTLDFLTKAWFQNQLEPSMPRPRFQLVRTQNKQVGKSAQELHLVAELCALKGQHQPGLVEV